MHDIYSIYAYSYQGLKCEKKTPFSINEKSARKFRYHILTKK